MQSKEMEGKRQVYQSNPTVPFHLDRQTLPGLYVNKKSHMVDRSVAL